MGIPKNLIRESKELNEWCVMACYRGSIAHGIYKPNSIDDKDVMVACVPPIEHYLGFMEYPPDPPRGWPGSLTREIKHNEWDIVVYEFRKLIKLLKIGNPNVLMTLWLDDNYFIKRTRAWDVITENRDAFVGKHVYRSFTGYAYSQLRRMTAYTFDGYMGQKRKELVDKFGYDCKNAAHLIRLLRMGIEFMNDGQLYVTRHDAAQLMEIKSGAWTLEQVKAEADRLFASAEEAYIHSKLPEGPDEKLIDALCVAAIIVALEEQHSIFIEDRVNLA